jgi:magnesium transporter
MVRGQEDLIAVGARRVADLEGRAMTGDPVTAEGVLEDLSRLGHDLQTIRINAAQTYELYDNLIDTLAVDHEVMQLDPRRLALLRQQYGHLKNSADLERDYLREVLEMLQTRLSNELNMFVRKITAYGTIAISWTVVAGVYGMNFADMPELNWTYGYPAALGLMLALSVTLWLLFRRHHWL